MYCCFLESSATQEEKKMLRIICLVCQAFQEHNTTYLFTNPLFFIPAPSPKSVQTPPSPVPSPPHSSEPVQFFGLLPPLPASSLTTQGNPPKECPVIPRKLPKRLNVAYFWARTRIVQKACMVSAQIRTAEGKMYKFSQTSR